MELYEKQERPANTQDAYERIRAWLGRPGASRCAVGTGHGDDYCVYRDNGNRCAIGGILPDDLLDVMDTYQGDVSEIISEFSQVEFFFDNVDEDFLLKAQSAHDRVAVEDEFDEDVDPPAIELFKSDAAWQLAALRRLDAAAREFELRVVA
jgi:hypothetical protein